jgi:hypothetical protein
VSYPAGAPFREFVVVIEDEIETAWGFAGAINYRTEPQVYRYPSSAQVAALKRSIQSAIRSNAKVLLPRLPRAVPAAPPSPDAAALFSNSLVGGDPQTPVFCASSGSPVRFRMIFAGGDVPMVLTIHGHVWQERPYLDFSRVIGDNSQLSQWFGAQQISPNENFDFVINAAGGEGGVTGDYLYDAAIQGGSLGTWGLLRVLPAGSSCPGTLASATELEQKGLAHTSPDESWMLRVDRIEAAPAATVDTSSMEGGVDKKHPNAASYSTSEAN